MRDCFAKTTWCCCVLIPWLAWGAGAAHAQDETPVTVTGKAIGASLSAQEEARSDALRQAVQQACGAFINSQTQVENYRAVYDHVMSLAVGFVQHYEIQKEWQDDQMSYCTISATVSAALVEREWAAFAHTYKREGYPRMIVVVLEDDDVDDGRPPAVGGVVQSAIENFFINKNVSLMDKSQSDSVRERDLSLAAINDDVNKLAAAASAFQAEVVLFGQANAKYAGNVAIGGRDVHRWDITLTIRAIQTDSARILTSNVYRPEKRYTSTARGSGSDALLQLGADAAPKILRELAAAWNSRDVNYRMCQLSLAPCSRRTFKTVREALGGVRGVQDGPEGIRLRELVNDVARVEVDWQFDLNMLADRLEELEIEGLSLEVTEQTANRLAVKVSTSG